jgi:hypothetical protein
MIDYWSTNGACYFWRFDKQTFDESIKKTRLIHQIHCQIMFSFQNRFLACPIWPCHMLRPNRWGRSWQVEMISDRDKRERIKFYIRIKATDSIWINHMKLTVEDKDHLWRCRQSSCSRVWTRSLDSYFLFVSFNQSRSKCSCVRTLQHWFWYFGDRLDLQLYKVSVTFAGETFGSSSLSLFANIRAIAFVVDRKRSFARIRPVTNCN